MVDKIISNEFEMISRYSEPYIHVYNSQGWLERYDVEKTCQHLPTRLFGGFVYRRYCLMKQSVPSVVEQTLNARHGLLT